MSQNLIIIAPNRSLTSSTAAKLLPEPLLDMERPLDLDLVPELDLKLRHISPEGTLNLDPEGSKSMLYTE